MGLLYLVRHGETVMNARGIVQGGLDSPLTPQGREQAERAARWLARHEAAFAVAVCSPQGRAQRTLDLMCAAEPVLAAARRETLSCLREYSYGTADGTSVHDLAGDPWNPRRDFQDLGGDTVRNVADGLFRALHDLMEQSAGSAVAVSHGTTMKLFVDATLAEDGSSRRLTPQELSNGCIVVMCHDSARKTFRLVDVIARPV